MTTNSKQKACGIICEYNPFHNGHKYQIDWVKQTLGMPVVCAMSGDFVQRGTPACMSKELRAAEAVKNGASVVLELPFPFSSMTAERFALAGVKILHGSGMCSHIAFGSECGDIALLTEIASALCDKTVKNQIAALQKMEPSLSFVRAREKVLGEVLGKEACAVLNGQNDILAVEYIKAIKVLGADLTSVAVKRTHERTDAVKETFASSSQIRALLADGKAEQAAAFVPDSAVLGHFSDKKDFENAVFLLLLPKKPADLRHICELGGGLEHALARAVLQSDSYAEAFEKLHFKTLTDAKIRRMMLFAALGVTSQAASDLPRYTFVLAAGEDESAKALLRMSRKEKSIIVARRIREVRKDLAAYEQLNLALLADRISGQVVK